MKRFCLMLCCLHLLVGLSAQIDSIVIDTTSGNALLCKAYGDNVVGDLDSIKVGSLTISAWVKPTATQSTYTGLFLTNSDDPIGIGFVNPENTLAYFYPGGQPLYPNSLKAPVNKWSHVAMVVNPDSVTLYLNGKSSSHVIQLDSAVIDTFLLGSFNNWVGRQYKGYIDELRVWNRALTEKELRLQRHVLLDTNNVKDSTLLLYYQFNNPELLPDSVYSLRNLVNGDTASLFGNVKFESIDAPFGKGIVDMLDVQGKGAYFFPKTRTKITFGDVTPQGEVVVTYLYNTPEIVPEGLGFPGKYIINNYGDNEIFGILDSISFQPPIFTPENDLLTGASKVKLFRRNDNGSGEEEWLEETESSFVGTAEVGFGKKSNPNTNISKFGQFYFGTDRCAYNISDVRICRGDSILINDEYVKDPGVYYNRVPTSFTCDSMVETFVNLIDPVYGADYRILCAGDSMLLGGIYRTVSGSYVDTVVATRFGCDSIIQVELDVQELLDTTVAFVGGQFVCLEEGNVTYQWFNCLSNKEIEGAVYAEFKPKKNGVYRVVVSDGTCTYSSGCHTYDNTSVGELNRNLNYGLYPNPTADNMVQFANRENEALEIAVYDVTGKEVRHFSVEPKSTTMLNVALPYGVYPYEVRSSSGLSFGKLVVQ